MRRSRSPGVRRAPLSKHPNRYADREVEAYEPVIRRYAQEYGIPEYVELIKAVMMQESGGQGLEPMQSSESGFNTEYPRERGGITDPEYS